MKLLLVDANEAFGRQLRSELRESAAMSCDLEMAASRADAVAHLGTERFDAILIDPFSLADAPTSVYSDLQQLAQSAPILILTDQNDDASAIDAVRQGAHDYLIKSQTRPEWLLRRVRYAIDRRRGETLAGPHAAQATQPATPRAAEPTERRQHARYSLTKPIFATPVLPDGSPAATQSAEGFSVDVSEGGLRFEIGNLQRLPTNHLLVGIEGLDTMLHFATVEARHVVQRGNGLDVGAQFAEGPRDLIRRENLEPSFNPVTARYETGLTPDVIKKWVEFGIFRPALLDRTFVCPRCRAIPTFRNGCRVCGSVRLHSRPLIHHFACAHVGYVSEFEQNGAIICPKCRTRNLMVGTDCEHLNGPYHCLDCDASDTELDTVGQCMKCELRFPMGQAIEEDVIGYHVNRLDPRAFIDAH